MIQLAKDGSLHARRQVCPAGYASPLVKQNILNKIRPLKARSMAERG
jgi:hypothetical protein